MLSTVDYLLARERALAAAPPVVLDSVGYDPLGDVVADVVPAVLADVVPDVLADVVPAVVSVAKPMADATEDDSLGHG